MPASKDQPLVGRASELQRLGEFVTTGINGSSGLLAIAGEPGIGKSRMLREIVRLVGNQADVRWGACSEDHESRALQPWREALRGISGPDSLVPREGSPAAAAETSVPGVAGSKQERDVVFDGVVAAIASAARSRPQFFLFDDVHFADDASIELLLRAVTDLARHPVSFCVTYRPHEGLRNTRLLQAWGETRDRRETLVLERLSVEDIRAWLALGPPVPKGSPSPEAVLARTDGVPFYIWELLRAGNWRELPLAAKERILGDRVAGLDPAARHRLKWASILGRRFSLPQLHDLEIAAAATLGDGKARSPHRDSATTTTWERIVASLEKACDIGLLHSLGEAAQRFEYTHALVREALYESMDSTTRATLHAHAFRSPSIVAASDSTERAEHALRAGPRIEPREAIAAFHAAAETSQRNFGFEAATDWHRRAVEMGRTAVARGLFDLEELAYLLLQHAEAAWVAGDPAASHQSQREAATLGRRLIAAGSPAGRDILARAALGWGTGALRTRVAPVEPATIADIREALRLHEDSTSPRHIALCARLAEALYYDASADADRDRYSRTALELARTRGDDHLLLSCLSSRWYAAQSPQLLEERIAIAQEMESLATRMGLPDVAAYSLVQIACTDLERGVHAKTEATLARLDAAAQRHPLPILLWAHNIIHTALRLHMGDAVAAAKFRGRAEALGPRAHIDYEQYSFVQAVQWERMFGDPSRPLPRLEHFANVMGQVIPAWRVLYASCLLESGREAEARGWTEANAELFPLVALNTHFTFFFATFAETIHRLHLAKYATATYQALAAQPSRNIAISGLVTLGSSHRFLALLSELQGETRRAREHFDDAVRENRKTQAGPALASTQLDYARFLIDHGEPSEKARAGELAEEARNSFRRMGMSRHAERAETLVQQLTHASGIDRAPSGSALHVRIERHDNRWHLYLRGREIMIRSCVGMYYLAALVTGQESLSARTLLEHYKPGGPQGKGYKELLVHARNTSQSVTRGNQDRESGGKRAMTPEQRLNELARRAVYKSFTDLQVKLRNAGGMDLADHLRATVDHSKIVDQESIVGYKGMWTWEVDARIAADVVAAREKARITSRIVTTERG